MAVWQNAEEEAANTAVIVASKRILERANFFKQQYLLKGNQDAELSEFRKSYSKSGWLLPINNVDRSCEFWLSLLYPKRQIFGAKLSKIEDMSDQTQFYCRYHYQVNTRLTSKYQIDVQLKQERFSVKTKILAL